MGVFSLAVVVRVSPTAVTPIHRNGIVKNTRWTTPLNPSRTVELKTPPYNVSNSSRAASAMKSENLESLLAPGFFFNLV